MLHVFYGDDSFSMREALHDLRARLDTDGSLDTNTVRINGREAPAADVFGACDTVPFLGETRLVIVEGFLAGARRRGRKNQTEGEEAAVASGALAALLNYLPRMPASTTLVLLEAGKPDVAKLAKLGDIRQFAPPEKAGVVTWVRDRAKMRGVKFEPRAASMLADYVGGDTWRLANEIEKLAAYANGATVTAIDVQSLVTPTREEMFWILPDPVADGKAGQALKALQTLRAQNEADQAMIGSIRARFVRIAIARSMLEEGARDEEIGRRLGASGFALTRLVEQARGWPMSSLRAAFAALVQAELDVKTGLMDQDVAMDLAVVGVADLRK